MGGKLAGVARFLDTYFARDGFRSVTSLDDAEVLAAYFGIKQMPDFRKLREDDRLTLLNNIFREVSKMPKAMREFVKERGGRIDLVLGSITNHPDMAYLKGTRPRGWAQDTKWDDIPGCGGHCTVIAANRLLEGHGSVNLILHEYAHTYDEWLGKKLGLTWGVSDSEEFRILHARTKWEKPYHASFREEAFAESFARYYDSPGAREALRRKYPEVYEFIRKHFPEERTEEAFGADRLRLIPRRTNQ